MPVIIGTIGAIMRYPVKSMLGETLDGCELGVSGVDGDRTHALVDSSTGKIASAKQPNLWRDLLAFSAKTRAKTGSQTNASIIISDGGGNQIDLTDPDFDMKVSEWLGRRIKLIDVRPAGIELNRARPDEIMTEGVEATVTQDVLAIASAAPTGGFFDFAPLHVMTSASLDATRAAAPAASIEAERYRPNIVIETPSSEVFAENHERLKASTLDPLAAEAGHYVFVPEATEAGRAANPDYCIDAPGVDRRSAHQHVAALAAELFELG